MNQGTLSLFASVQERLFMKYMPLRALQTLLLFSFLAGFSSSFVATTSPVKRTTTPWLDMSASDESTVGQMLGGLTFLKTRDRTSIVNFYMGRIGMKLWLEQPEITILSHGNMLIGFHQIIPHDDDDYQPADISGMYTFVYPSKGQVDDMYSKLADIADGPPRINEKYQIYQFFATDPEERQLEFQAFLHLLRIVSSDPKSME